ncbi:hypothetical protein BHM03_00023112, partial [Ensete ventricosum]
VRRKKIRKQGRFTGGYNNTHPMVLLSLGVLLLLAGTSPVFSEAAANNTFRPGEELRSYRRVRAHLRRLNKPAVKTIQALVSEPSCFLLCGIRVLSVLPVEQSPDGDTIDCVLSHLQPAFDHPGLKGMKPLVIERKLLTAALHGGGEEKAVDFDCLQDPPERPKGHRADAATQNSFQLWRVSGESCPGGTVPIRRTKEEDILRASSVKRFGRKLAVRSRHDSETGGHEVNPTWLQHAVGYVVGDQYYGAKASLNVWAPKVTSPSEFSLSQVWVISGSFGTDLNTIEAGWQVHRIIKLYSNQEKKKKREKQFMFLSRHSIMPFVLKTDAYQATGCYNLLCSGFIQTNNMIAIGAAISPTSTYDGGQFDISLLVWKDPNHGNWWLELGSGELVGYWPSFLFSHLSEHASMVQFGGEIVNTQPQGLHTATQMGSGHYAREGFGRASYFRNLQVVDWDNSLIPVANLRVLADRPSCYDIQGGINTVWGNYFYYGGPGRNDDRCN